VFDSAVIKGKFNRGLYCAETIIRRQKKIFEKNTSTRAFFGDFPWLSPNKTQKNPHVSPSEKNTWKGTEKFSRQK